MPKPPESTKSSLAQRLNTHGRARWPDLDGIGVRFRGNFAYISSQLPGDHDVRLCRLRYGGSANSWGFAFYRASHDDYEDSFLPTGSFGGTPEEALDCAGSVYLDNPIAWEEPPNTPTHHPAPGRTHGASHGQQTGLGECSPDACTLKD